MKRFAIFVLILAGHGCAMGYGEGPVEGAPQVLGISRDAVSVGEPIEVIGGNFLKEPDAHTEIRFDGVYETESGETHDVALRFRPHWEDGNKLVWAQVGPFRVPFHPEGDEIGVFSGTLTAINVFEEQGAEVESEPLPVDLEIEPSIILNELQPMTAQCDAPSRVILGGFPYRVGVEAIGFEPVNFSYVVGGEPNAEAPRIYRQKAVSNLGEFGDGGELMFQPVPGNVPFYVGTLAVTALGTDDKEHALSLSIGVHNPIEHMLLNKVKVAEIEPAAPVSGCMAGGDTNGRTVTYSEQETDTRERSVGVTWNETWLEQQQSTSGGSTTTTNSVSFDVSQSETQGWEMGWESLQGHELGGGAGGTLFGLVEANVEGKYIDHDKEFESHYGSSTRGYTVGRDYSVSDTESWAFTQIRGHEVSRGGSDFWTVSSSQSTIVSFEGLILPGEYGVFYRQTTRLAIPGVVVAYNLCGNPEVVAETNFYDYTWSVDLAQGAECPPLPESDLPEAQCFVAPCSSPE